MVAFLSSQICDVVVYGKVKVITKGHSSLCATIYPRSSQLVNSSLFITIAVYASQPVLKLITGSILLQWLIGVIDTLFVYFGVRVIHRALDGKTLAYEPVAWI